ncbi:MAG: glycosyltransferase [Acidimicrobiia bacterium]|nr:glycosyltransferase [Acidimicrobiia bacterium]
MKPRLLVATTVHPAEDPRIRRKLIGTLQNDWDVVYAGVGDGPVDRSGLEWMELAGSRPVRWLRAARLILSGRYDVASLHDPELLPLGIVAALLGRKVVFDVHENVPDQIRTKDWLLRPLRRPLAAIFGWMLRLAEKRVAITLAEAGYARLFRHSHPVFANYPMGELPRGGEADPAVGVVYLGDLTEARGLAVAVEAAGIAQVEKVTLLGRCSSDFRSRLEGIAAAHDLQLEFHGFVPSERALALAARGVVGLSPLLDLPNYRDSLPTKVLEYLAVGVPTLASDLPGTRTVVGGRAGVMLVTPGDVAAWADAIAAAVADPDLRAEAGKGSAEIRAAFVWPEQEVRGFYRDLL